MECIAVTKDCDNAPIYLGDTVLVDGLYKAKVFWIKDLNSLGIYGFKTYNHIKILEGSSKRNRVDAMSYDHERWFD